MKKIAFPLAAAALAAMALSAVVAAHAHLEKSEPAEGAELTAAPKHVELWFNEDVDAAVSTIELVGPGGKVPVGRAHVMEPKTLMADVSGTMAAGQYTVVYQTAGDDGHTQKGTYTFSLKGR